MITDDQLRAIVRGETGSQSSTELIRAIAAELLEARHRVLVPLTESEVVAALHEGHAERRAAQGDNAWTTILADRARLRAALLEACDIADRRCQLMGSAARVVELRKIAQGGS